jgi:hypothetical protein
VVIAKAFPICRPSTLPSSHPCKALSPPQAKQVLIELVHLPHSHSQTHIAETHGTQPKTGEFSDGHRTAAVCLSNPPSPRGASKPFKPSEEARIESNCLALHLSRIERFDRIWEARIGI